MVGNLARKVGRYDILGALAAGGMAEILLGRLIGPSGFERVVVIKRILPHLAGEKAFVEMFLDEARTVARIRHPNVVQVHELGGDGDGSELYLVMEYLEGESAAGLLRRLCLKGEGLDPWLAAHIVAESCRGLHAAHELTDDNLPLDIVHRDVSPQNIFVTYSGAVKVLDFGIAKAADRIVRTEAGQVKGKFAYMSPEQCTGKPLDRRSDVFALGAVLYELLTGRRVFKRATELMTLKAICEQPVAPPSTVVASTPAALDAVCLRALERRRDDRYPSAADMRRDLLAAMRTLGHDDDPEERLSRLMRELFASRIDEKQEMLRKARALSQVTNIPCAETDGSIELPEVDEVPTIADVTADVPPDVPATNVPPRRRRWLAWSSAGLVGGLGLGVVLSLALRREPPRPASNEDRAASAAPEPPAPTPTQTAVAPAALPAEVALHIETTPPGARVSIAGRDVGTTPLDTRVARGTSAVDVVLRAPGFAPLTTSVVPDVEQRLMLTLRAAGRSSKPTAAAPAPPAAPAIEKLP
ncbi:serine/threonine protein kinase [Minicystis rosea]|nr:serine/threonine protein kinase [Minicystis rosea]